MDLLDFFYVNFGWILFSFVCILFYATCIDSGKYGVATFGTVIILAVLYKMTNLFDWILTHKLLIVGIFLGYFLIIGAPYALFEWWWLVRQVREINRKEKNKWLNNWKTHLQNTIDVEEEKIWERSQGKMTEELFPLWQKKARTLSYDLFGRCRPITKPHPKEYKDFIIACIVLWPLFLTCNWVLDYPVRVVYNLILSSLKNIANYEWKNEDEIHHS